MVKRMKSELGKELEAFKCMRDLCHVAQAAALEEAMAAEVPLTTSSKIPLSLGETTRPSIIMMLPLSVAHGIVHIALGRHWPSVLVRRDHVPPNLASEELPEAIHPWDIACSRGNRKGVI